jgi:hypothetical protein
MIIAAHAMTINLESGISILDAQVHWSSHVPASQISGCFCSTLWPALFGWSASSQALTQSIDDVASSKVLSHLNRQTRVNTSAFMLVRQRATIHSWNAAARLPTETLPEQVGTSVLRKRHRREP